MANAVQVAIEADQEATKGTNLSAGTSFGSGDMSAVAVLAAL